MSLGKNLAIQADQVAQAAKVERHVILDSRRDQFALPAEEQFEISGGAQSKAGPGRRDDLLTWNVILDTSFGCEQSCSSVLAGVAFSRSGADFFTFLKGLNISHVA
jgi:hypothetical protein